MISEISNPKIVPLISSPVFIRSFPYFQDGRPPQGLPFPTKSFPKTTSGFSQFKGEVGFWGTQKSHGNGTQAQKWVQLIPCPKVVKWSCFEHNRHFDLWLPLVSMGTLGLNNFNSSPEGSTKIGTLIAIGYSYLCIKFQLSSSSRYGAIRVETTCHSFLLEKSSLRKSL